MSNKRLTQSPSWLDLLAHTERLAKAPLKDLLTETGRHNEFSTQACGLVMDFSRQHLDRDSLQSYKDRSIDWEECLQDPVLTQAVLIRFLPRSE